MRIGTQEMKETSNISPPGHAENSKAVLMGGQYKPDSGVEMLNLHSKVPEMQWVTVSGR